MARVGFDGVTKRFGDVVALRELSLDDRGRRVRRVRRAVGLGQDDGAAAGRRAGGADGGRDQRRRPGGEPPGAARPRHRDGVPGLRAVSADDGAAEPGVRACGCGRWGGREIEERVAAGGRHARHRVAAGAEAARAVGRPAAAGGAGPGAGPRAEGVPDGRAAVEPGREAARADPDRDQAPPGAGRDDDDLRDARPGRGDDDGRPRRGDERGRARAGGRHADGLRAPGERVRRGVHREPVDELRDAGGVAGGRRGGAAAGRGVAGVARARGCRRRCPTR